MSEFKSCRSYNYNTNAIKIQQYFLILLFNVLVKTGQIESNDISLFLSDRQQFPVSSVREKRGVYVPNKMVCFYVLTRSFNPEIMDGLCTHIHVGFFGINNDSYTLKVSNDQEQILKQVVLLKEKSKDLKVLITVGGAGDTSFSSMIFNHTSRKIFIKSCMQFIKKFKVDGIDLDWEWPVIESGDKKEKVKFVQLLREIREEFNRHKKRYFLSLDVPAAQQIIELGYYVNYIADFVDYVNVMCYDYHYFTKLLPFTGHNAPLYPNANNIFSKSSVNQSIYFWIWNAMPREKTVLGVPTYGHSFKLTFPEHHSLGAPAKGFGSVGAGGFASYQDICQFLRNNKTTVVYDTVSKTPYAYEFREWISFDNEQSLAEKASYVLEEKLAGVMVFSVNADDYTGSCNGDNIPLPLIKVMASIKDGEMVNCPYNVAHVMLKGRLAAHLVKCRAQHPVSKYTVCPFNSTHMVPEPELEYHVLKCPERKNLENYVYVVGEPVEENVPSHIDMPVSSENWDEEDIPSYLNVMDKKVENSKAEGKVSFTSNKLPTNSEMDMEWGNSEGERSNNDNDTPSSSSQRYLF